jgi:hypothetical protein
MYTRLLEKEIDDVKILIVCLEGVNFARSTIVNIVTTTTTNEAGEQIVIIENLDQHSPELQREILNALLADGLHPVAQ